jgi:hypothetical protein
MKEEKIIGNGGARVVYKGIIPNGEHVVVKKLMGIGSSNDSGFLVEIKTLGSICYRNIVRLLAFCSNVENNPLMYE